MKTAITLLFEEFEALSKASRDAGDSETAGLIDFLCERKGVALEKEKEQIIDAYYGKIDGVFGYREEGQEYYNQTYNQNK